MSNFLGSSVGVSDNVSCSMASPTRSSLGIIGRVEKIVRDADGKIVEFMPGENTVLNNGRIKLLKGLTGASLKITKCALGDGGTSSSDAFVPEPPSPTDIGLKNPILTKNVGSWIDTSTDDTVSLTFSTLFMSDEVDGVISEAAMILSDASTFSRHTFPSIYLKGDRGFSLEVRWTFVIEQKEDEIL